MDYRRLKSLPLEEATSRKTFRGNLFSDLGLVDDKALPFRVYVLLCKSTAQGQPGFYVGVVGKERLEQRLQDHSKIKGAAFTKERKAESLLFLHPAASLAAEAYIYAATLAAVNDEKVVTAGHVGGWTQTFPTSNVGKQQQAQTEREFRMVTDRCLICGSTTHKAAECTPARRESETRAPRTSLTVLEPTSHVAPQLAPRIPMPSDTDLFELWFSGSNPTKRNLETDVVDGAWLPMVRVLAALGERSKNNSRRYLCEDSDSRKKQWRVGAAGALGVEDRDWKNASSSRGGGGKKGGVYLVRKCFLKKVVLTRYRHRLRPH